MVFGECLNNEMDHYIDFEMVNEPKKISTVKRVINYIKNVVNKIWKG